MADSNDERIFKTVTAPSTSVFKQDIFKGKVLFCTGGGSGICKAMTQQIMKHGANAAIVGRKFDRLNAAAKELEQGAGNGTKCIATPGDVRKIDDLKAAVQKVNLFSINLFYRSTD
jgi:peroxisomal 2,4-dienoyl-CoA reductase